MKIKGRASSTEEKKDIINRLYNLWLCKPELRLGQLIVNSIDRDLFYIEDDTLISMIEDLISE